MGKKEGERGSAVGKPKTNSPVPPPGRALSRSEPAYFQNNQWQMTKNVGRDRWQVRGYFASPCLQMRGGSLSEGTPGSLTADPDEN